MARSYGLLLLLLCVLTFAGPPALAHEVRPAMVTLVESETTPGQFELAFKQPVREGRRLRLTLVFPDACTAGALRQEMVPGAIIDRGTLHCPVGGLDRIGAEGLDRTLTDIFVDVRRTGAPPLTGVLRGGASALSLADDPAAGVGSSVSSYLFLGVEHILFGYDHLLFVIGMLVLVRSRQLVLTLTAFTLGHSLTLGLAALGAIGLPGPPVEIVIALSLVLLAVEGVARLRGEAGLSARFPWLVAAGFGLVHGFGFAGALGAIGLPEGGALMALFLFNLGVELGQLLVVAGAVLLGWALASLRAGNEQTLRFVAAYCVGTAGAYWVIARSAALLT